MASSSPEPTLASLPALAPPNSAADVTTGTEELTWPMADRRRGGDRRQRPTKWWDSLVGHRRRRRGRRKGESRNIYVDIYHIHDMIVVAIVFVLNIFDAVLTLSHLAAGGVEENPLMENLIDRGPGLFLLEKIFIVGFSLMIVAVHKNFTVARRGAYVLLLLYGLLTLRHMTL